MRHLAIALTAITLATPAFAHSAKVGAHGGAQADAGNYHVELVANQKTVDIYIRDHADKAVAGDGFKGMAILVIAGQVHRIELKPAGDNRLSGAAAVDVPAGVKGAVQLTMPNGTTAQAKF